MCGIYARVSPTKFKLNDALIKAKQLESRGYDSYGYLYGENSVHKQIGEVAIDVHNPIETNLFIFHCRWATHGKVSLENTHPISASNKVDKNYVFHNGIISNYPQILMVEGTNLTSGKTDTRALASLLLNKFDFNDVYKSVHEARKVIDGTYACVFKFHNDDRVIAFCKENPLYYNIYGEISSEPFIKYSDKLNDNTVLILSKKSFRVIYNRRGHYYQGNIIELNEDFVEKKTDMLDEIKEQGKIKCYKDININKEKIILFGCGSSYYAGMLGAKYLQNICGFDARIEYASEFFPCESDVRDRLFISLTQSGETLDVIEKVKLLKNFGANQKVITNNINSTIVNVVGKNNCYDIGVGKENAVAATKSFTGQCLTLLYSTGLQILNYLGDFNEVINIDIDEIVNIVSKYNHCIYLGHNLNYPIALEGALKMKEVAYIHAEAMPSAEFRHGPIALIDDSVLCVFIVSGDSSLDRIKGNMEQVKSRKGKILTICDNYSYKEIEKITDYSIIVPLTSNKYIQPLINNIPLQILAYKVALIKGFNPNRPRNLAKTITVY